MEPHKKIQQSLEAYRPRIENGPFTYFKKAYAFATCFYEKEIDAIASVKFDDIAEDFFFREYIWVVHATGFSAKVVGTFMPRLLEAYGFRTSTWCGTQEYELVLEKVRYVVNNPPKIKAVWTVAKMVQEEIGSGKITWDAYKEKFLSTPEKLTQLPYIGKVTCFHLARNLGLLESVKPDLHLVRMAKHWNFVDCIKMCEAMRDHHQLETGIKLPLGIVDLILWYSASTFGTVDIRVEGDR